MVDPMNPQDLQQVLDKIHTIVQDGASKGNVNDSYSKFVDQVVEDKGFVGLEPAVMAELKKDIRKKLDDFVAARVITAFSDNDVLVFEKMLNEGRPQEEIQKFTVEHIPDFVTFLTNVLLEFRAVYLGLVRVPPSVDTGVANELKKQELKPSNLPPAPVATPPSTINGKKLN